MTIAVIIPVWNDAQTLGAAIASALDSAGKTPHAETATETSHPTVEVIVVDAASDDGSADVARTAGARLLTSSVRQRAAQMNLGARAARADVLLFLHADTQLPSAWTQAITTALAADPRVLGGAFRRRFVPGSWFLRATCAAADIRGRWWGWFLGDQAMFVRQEAFARLGGFAPLRVCEDLDFSRRLARLGRAVLLRAVVRSSDRRFRARGALRQTWADAATTWRFLRARDSFLENAPESIHR